MMRPEKEDGLVTKKTITKENRILKKEKEKSSGWISLAQILLGALMVEKHFVLFGYCCAVAPPSQPEKKNTSEHEKRRIIIIYYLYIICDNYCYISIYVVYSMHTCCPTQVLSSFNDFYAIP